MRRTIWVLPVLLLFVSILVPAAANATTYSISQPLPGGGNITGTITTNGTMGTISYIDINSFSFGMSAFGDDGTSNLGSGPGHVDLGDLTANSTGLVFNFGAGNGGDLYFPVTNSNGSTANGPSYIQWIAGQCPICGEIEAVNIGGDGMTDALTGLTSAVVIGTVVPAATPEPGSLSLLGAGLFGLAGIARRLATRAKG